MASISVPIEKYKHSSGAQMFDRHRQSYGADSGPPYIVKLMNLPITANDDFVEDLFQSRYTSFVKFKIVADPSSNILETHVIKKVAFVELHSFLDMNKVLKWQDLYYKGNRRVVVEEADFGNFQHCMSFNQEHQAEISQIESDFLSGKSKPPPRREILQRPDPRPTPFPELRQEPKPEQHKPKVNPFGLAKPVDILLRSQEIDKKLITINHTTIQTLGPDADIEFDKKKPNILRRKSGNHPSSKSPETQKSHTSSPPANEDGKPTLRPAPIPQSYSKPVGVSLAEILSNKPDGIPRSSSAQNKNSSKPTVLKPVILKKKHIGHENSVKQNGDASNDHAQQDEGTSLSTIMPTEISAPSADGESAPKDIDSNAPVSLDRSEANNEERSSDSFKLTTVSGKLSGETRDIELNVKEKEDRPNFKKQLDRLTNRSHVSRERTRGVRGSRQGVSRLPNSVYKRGDSLESQDVKEPKEPREPSEPKEQTTQRENTKPKENKQDKEDVEHNDHKDSKKHRQHKWDDKIDLNYRIKDEAASDAKVARVIENSVKARTKSLSERGRGRGRGRGRSKGGRGDGTTSASDDRGIRDSMVSENGSSESNGASKPKEVSPRKRNGSKSVEPEKQVDTQPDVEHKVVKDVISNDASSDAKDVHLTELNSAERNGRRFSNGRSVSPSKRLNEDEKGRRASSRGRGRGPRGRGRGRGAVRGNVFNLHYVRKHDEPTESTTA